MPRRGRDELRVTDGAWYPDALLTVFTLETLQRMRRDRCVETFQGEGPRRREIVAGELVVQRRRHQDLAGFGGGDQPAHQRAVAIGERFQSGMGAGAFELVIECAATVQYAVEDVGGNPACRQTGHFSGNGETLWRHAAKMFLRVGMS